MALPYIDFASQEQIHRSGVHLFMDWRIAAAQHAAERAAVTVHEQMARGVSGLATVAATAPFIGMFGNIIGIYNSFPGCGTEKTTYMAIVMGLLGRSLIPTALGLAVAIMAAVGWRYLGGRLAEFDAGMAEAVLDLPGWLSGCAGRG